MAANKFRKGLCMTNRPIRPQIQEREAMDELDASVGDGEREDVQHDQPDACERRDRKERHRDGSDANPVPTADALGQG